MKCARKACQANILNRTFVDIYNVPSVIGGHQKYCMPCGRQIMEANPSLHYEIHDAVQGNQELCLPVPAQGMAGDGRVAD